MRTETVNLAAIRQCPHLILTVAHYRPDGPCRCVDTAETLAAKAELAEAEADLLAARQRVREARRKVEVS